MTKRRKMNGSLEIKRVAPLAFPLLLLQFLPRHSRLLHEERAREPPPALVPPRRHAPWLAPAPFFRSRVEPNLVESPCIKHKVSMGKQSENIKHSPAPAYTPTSTSNSSFTLSTRHHPRMGNSTSGELPPTKYSYALENGPFASTAHEGTTTRPVGGGRLRLRRFHATLSTQNTSSV